MIYRSNFFINYQELRYRFVYYIISFCLTFCLSLYYGKTLLFIGMLPVRTFVYQFMFVTPLDYWMLLLKIAFLVTFVILLPIQFYFFGYFFFRAFSNFYTHYFFLLFQGLYLTEVFVYIYYTNVIWPYIFRFMLSYQHNFDKIFRLVYYPNLIQYFSLYLGIFFFFGILLCFPVILVVSHVLKKKNEKSFRFFFRKYMYLCLIFITIIISPPNILLQLLILPILLIVFEIQLFFANIFLAAFFEYEDIT